MSEPPIVPDSLTTPNERPPGYRGTRAAKSPSGVFVTFFLIVLVAGMAVLGWLLWQQHQSMVAGEQELANALARIELLSEQQTSIDSTFTESTTTTDDALEFWESEIRKLWDVSNVRNKNNIDQNRNAIAANTRARKQLEDRLDSIQKSIGDLERSIAAVTRQQRDLTDTINTTLAQARQSNDNLKSTVEQNQRAINAIDASRSQNNARLLDISRRLSILENR